MTNPFSFTEVSDVEVTEAYQAIFDFILAEKLSGPAAVIGMLLNVLAQYTQDFTEDQCMKFIEEVTTWIHLYTETDGKKPN